MLKKHFKLIYLFILLTLFHSSVAKSEVIKNIIIEGNERVSNETILVFSSINLGDKIDTDKLNEIVNNLYDTNFFDDISTSFKNNELFIKVVESPIISKVEFTGIKSKTLIDDISKNLKLKSRSSFNKYQLQIDKLEIENQLKNKGYYYSTIEIYQNTKNNKTIDLIYEIDI